MKAKNIPLILLILVTGCITLSACSNKINIDEKRAKEQLIPIDQANEYQKKFIASHEELAKLITDSSFLKKQFNLPDGETFNRDMIGHLLNQDGTDGIRIYYGEDEKGQIRLVLLPVDKEGKAIIVASLANIKAINIPGISSASAKGGGGGVAGENGQGCQPCH